MNDPVNRPSPDLPPDPRGRAGHEVTDASPYYVGLFGLGLVLMIALVLPLLAWLFSRLEAAAERSDPLQSPVAGSQSPSEPRLESNPADELGRFRREQVQKLSNYGWIDRERGVVRIPVDQAIEILAERGLPEPEGPLEPAKREERIP